MSFILVVKVTLVLALSLSLTLLARRQSAALRHALIVTGQLAALAMPLLVPVVPPVAIDLRDATPLTPSLSPLSGERVAESRVRGGPELAAVPQRNIWLWLYLSGLSLTAAAKLSSLARAAMIVRRARREGDVLLSDEIDQPSTFFHWILLPGNRTWSKAVLLHEQAHVARRDTLVGLIGDAACAVYWFHPLAWISARIARLERERACDDLVLSRGIDATDYAATMLDVARSVSRRHAAALPMAERSQLEKRIRSVLDPNIRRRASGAGAILMLLAAPLLAALTPAGVVPRPSSMEPDLRNDSPPSSERIEPPAPLRTVKADGPDARLIAIMLDAARIPKRADDDYVAERARWALAQIRDGELVEPLLDAMRDHDWRVRAYAAWALGYSGDARATAPLIEMLSEPAWRLRAMAAHALANLGDPRAESAMLGVIDDPAWQVRMGVVQYLGAIGGHRATIEAMKQDRHMAVRTAAENAR